MKLRSIRIGFLLLLLLSLSLLVACGGGGETASEGSSESAPAEGDLSFTVHVTDESGTPARAADTERRNGVGSSRL
jgi:ABC-type Fe3+-hydroxamate transport system substrate-binding protein